MVVLGIATPKGWTVQQAAGMYPPVGDFFYQEALTGTVGSYDKKGKYLSPLPTNIYKQPLLVLPKKIKGKRIPKGKIPQKKIKQPVRKSSYGQTNAKKVLSRQKAAFGRVTRRRRLNMSYLRRMGGFGIDVNKLIRRAEVKAGAEKNRIIRKAMVKAGAAKNKAISGLQKGTIAAIQAPFKGYNKTFAGKLGKAVVTSKYVGAPSRYIAKLTGARSLSKYPALLRSNRPTRGRAARFGATSLSYRQIGKKMAENALKQVGGFRTDRAEQLLKGELQRAKMEFNRLQPEVFAKKIQKAKAKGKTIKLPTIEKEASGFMKSNIPPYSTTGLSGLWRGRSYRAYKRAAAEYRNAGLGLGELQRMKQRGARFGSRAVKTRVSRQSTELKNLAQHMIKRGRGLGDSKIIKKGNKLLKLANTSLRLASYGQKKKVKCSKSVIKNCCPKNDFMSREQCKLFLENNGRFNPLTGRYIIPRGPTWNRLMSQCRSLGPSNDYNFSKPLPYNISKSRTLPIRRGSGSYVNQYEKVNNWMESTNSSSDNYIVTSDRIEIKNALGMGVPRVYKKGDIVMYQGRGDNSPQKYEIYQFGKKRFEIVNITTGAKKRPKITELVGQNPSGPVIIGGGGSSSSSISDMSLGDDLNSLIGGNNWGKGGRRTRQRQFKYIRKI